MPTASWASTVDKVHSILCELSTSPHDFGPGVREPSRSPSKALIRAIHSFPQTVKFTELHYFLNAVFSDLSPANYKDAKALSEKLAVTAANNLHQKLGVQVRFAKPPFPPAQQGIRYVPISNVHQLLEQFRQNAYSYAPSMLIGALGEKVSLDSEQARWSQLIGLLNEKQDLYRALMTLYQTMESAKVSAIRNKYVPRIVASPPEQRGPEIQQMENDISEALVAALKYQHQLQAFDASFLRSLFKSSWLANYFLDHPKVIEKDFPGLEQI